MSSMQLCLMIEGQEDVAWTQWVALARACESHGIPAMFRSDHYMNFDGRHAERIALDAWGTICALAATTSTVRLGTMVSPATFRHPSELAKLVTTADHVSRGRIELGLGAGWHEPEHAAYGFAFADTRTRVDVLEEQLQVVLGHWGPGPFSFAGEHYTLTALDAQPKPLQSPHPPLIVGGGGGARSLRLAATYATEYNSPVPTLAEVRDRIRQLEVACQTAGRDPIPFSIVAPIVVGADEMELRERAARVAELMDSNADDLVSDPPAGWLVGTTHQVTLQLEALRDAGVQRVMCLHFDHADLEMVALIGEQLAPRLAASAASAAHPAGGAAAHVVDQA